MSKSCPYCGNTTWELERRAATPLVQVKPDEDEPFDEEMFIYHRCSKCLSWTDETLPEGWRWRLAVAVIRRKSDNEFVKGEYITNHTYATLEPDYDNSARRVKAWVQTHEGYPPENYDVEIRHSDTRRMDPVVFDCYKQLNGWEERRLASRKEKKMKTSVSINFAKEKREPTQVERGGLYIQRGGTHDYVVLCAEESCPGTLRTPIHDFFVGVVIWSSDGAPWEVGKVFPTCDKRSYVPFKGKIIMEQQ